MCVRGWGHFYCVLRRIHRSATLHNAQAPQTIWGPLERCHVAIFQLDFPFCFSLGIFHSCSHIIHLHKTVVFFLSFFFKFSWRIHPTLCLQCDNNYKQSKHLSLKKNVIYTTITVHSTENSFFLKLTFPPINDSSCKKYGKVRWRCFNFLRPTILWQF